MKEKFSGNYHTKYLVFKRLNTVCCLHRYRKRGKQYIAVKIGCWCLFSNCFFTWNNFRSAVQNSDDSFFVPEALVFGSDDFAADIGATRTKDSSGISEQLEPWFYQVCRNNQNQGFIRYIGATRTKVLSGISEQPEPRFYQVYRSNQNKGFIRYIGATRNKVLSGISEQPEPRIHQVYRSNQSQGFIRYIRATRVKDLSDISEKPDPRFYQVYRSN